MKPIYLDNNATTQTALSVVEAMTPYFHDLYGNPSSMHTFGGQVAKAVQEARSKVASVIGARPEEIIFTSCGTESNNTAIWAALESYPNKRHIVTTRVEHPAVLNTAKFWEKKGYKVTFLPVDRYGNLDPASVESCISDDTAIVSIMWANNETGTIFDIERIAQIVKAKGAVFHTDAVQGSRQNTHQYGKQLLRHAFFFRP